MTKQEAEALVKQHGSERAAAKASGIARSTFQNIVAGKTTSTGKAQNKETRKGKTLADFRATYDKAFIVPRKIKTALQMLGASAWEYEVAFAKLAEVSLADLGIFRDQFAAHVVSLREGRRAWAGSVATAKAMREML